MKVYASKAEMQYLQFLHGLVNNGNGSIGFVREQPKFTLGCPENVYVADAAVYAATGEIVFVVDIKGTETPAFRKVKKLWAAYGQYDLHIVKKTHDTKSGPKFKTVEVIVGGQRHKGSI